MTLIRTLWTSKKTLFDPNSTSTYVAHQGEIWYANDTGDLRYSDGRTPGGIPVSSNLAGGTSINVDGGGPSSTYGGITPLDGGSV